MLCQRGLLVVVAIAAVSRVGFHMYDRPDRALIRLLVN